MKTIGSVSILLLFLAMARQAEAQETPKDSRKQSFPISIAVNNHSWAMPFSKMFRLAPIYPGFTVGTELYYRNRERSQFFQTLDLGGFVNPSSGSALYAHSNLGYRRTAKSGFRWEVGLGLGHFRGYYPRSTYQLGESGNYEKLEKGAIPTGSNNLTVGIGYDLSKSSNYHITPFIKYQWMVSTTYWSLLGIRPNGLLHLGIQFKPFTSNHSS